MRRYLFKQVHNPYDDEMEELLEEVCRNGWILDKVTSSDGSCGRNIYMFFYKDE